MITYYLNFIFSIVIETFFNNLKSEINELFV